MLRLGIGPEKAARAAARGEIVVIVDTLSFSTTVVTAVSRGVRVYPCTAQDEAGSIAQALGAEASVRRAEVPTRGRFSLSPLSFERAEAGARVVLASPNGGGCCRAARGAADVWIAGLVNASAVAAALDREDRATTIIACDELGADGSRRPALEDRLGAGAILAASHRPRDPAAEEAVAAFREHRAHLCEVLLGCESGEELIESGCREDVLRAVALDRFGVVPVLEDAAAFPTAIVELGSRERDRARD